VVVVDSIQLMDQQGTGTAVTSAKTLRRAGSRRHRTPYGWLGASAVGVGVGVWAALAGGVAVAHADDAVSNSASSGSVGRAASATANSGVARRASRVAARGVAGKTPVASVDFSGAAAGLQPGSISKFFVGNGTDASRTSAKILSASWGANGSSGDGGVDNVPVTFNWFIDPASVAPADFLITRDDGTTTTPVFATFYPPDEKNERQTVDLIGNFGDPAGARPISVTITGALTGRAMTSALWQEIPAGLTHAIDQIAVGPYIADAWVLTSKMLQGDKNCCTVGKNFVRVVWSNGVTAYPHGDEVGAAVVNSYSAVLMLRNGKTIIVKPLAVGDLADHLKTSMDDNMHDLCLPTLPKGAKLIEIRIGASMLEDPNGDPNLEQHFKL